MNTGLWLKISNISGRKKLWNLIGNTLKIPRSQLIRLNGNNLPEQ